MNITPDTFDPSSDEQRANLFTEIRSVFPHLNDGMLEAALRAVATSKPSRSRSYWFLHVVLIAVAIPVLPQLDAATVSSG